MAKKLSLHGKQNDRLHETKSHYSWGKKYNAKDKLILHAEQNSGKGNKNIGIRNMSASEQKLSTE
jgi:hypothetical protein